MTVANFKEIVFYSYYESRKERIKTIWKLVSANEHRLLVQQLN